MGCHREYRKKLLQWLTRTTFEEIGLCQVLLAKQLSWSEFLLDYEIPESLSDGMSAKETRINNLVNYWT